MNRENMLIEADELLTKLDDPNIRCHHPVFQKRIRADRLQEEAQYERVITYCGGIAATVNAMAHLMAGNENVAIYDGSMSEWVGDGLPISTGGIS